MRQLAFYITYAFRNLRRSGRWSVFAIFSVGAGVATVVALRSLGLGIADSLVDNVRASNHGDIRITRSFGGFFSDVVNDEDDLTTFSDTDMQRIERFVSERDGAYAAYIRTSNFQVTAVDEVRAGRPQFASGFLIDPETFPPPDAGEIYALEPAGVPLSDLFSGGSEIVISENLAQTENLTVGDTVRVSGTDEPFTVVGIVPTDAEANVRNIFAAFFGFAYVDIANAEQLQIDPQPNTVAITLPPERDMRADAELLRRQFRRVNVTSVPYLLEVNQEIGDFIGRFIVTMGLGALLIGGVGIINTMLVMVGRRTSEIAALKTFGLKGRQITLLFMAEALMLGFAGSVVGTLFGLALTGVVNQYGETFLQQRIAWRFYPEAVWYGLGLGLLVTLVFGIVPVLTANRVRPAAILRPNETVLPGVGCLHSLLAIVLVVVVIGGVAGQILGVWWLGLLGVAAALLIMGLLVGLLWLLVWLIGRLPAFGWVDLQLALRNLTARRVRTATTLLALSTGMFALSSIAITGAGTREILQFQMTQRLGGNVLIFPTASLVAPTIAQTLLQAQLQTIDGIDSAATLAFYDFDVLALNGEVPEIDIPFVDEAELSEGRRRPPGFLDPEMTVTTWDQNLPTASRDILAGRNLTEADRGQNVMVLALNQQWLQPGDAEVGSVVTLEINNRPVDFEVVGLFAPADDFAVDFALTVVPPEALEGVRPEVTFNVLQVPPESLNQVLLDLTTLFPPVLALDVQFLDGLIGRFIDQFSAIPTVVGLLSLLAAAVIMANTVALGTLERRRQIGILKAIGLKGRRVLIVMLLENTLIGLLGGLIGIGLSALGIAIATAFTTGVPIPIPRDATLATIVLVLAAVIIAWVATFASARVAIRERVTNVLRYE